ncbi:hypothetical protein DOE76_06230 [Leifsonia sp. ku-ls]|nr:hypothetical protein DOE76_06230 [Leifsonia sp. ku-ls]
MRSPAADARRWPGDTGSVTAEFALTVPAVLACVALCVAVVIGAASYAGLAASAAAAARLVARGDDPAGAGIPEGSAVSIEPEGRTTCVRLTAREGALSAVGVHISARACALDEGKDE